MDNKQLFTCVILLSIFTHFYTLSVYWPPLLAHQTTKTSQRVYTFLSKTAQFQEWYCFKKIKLIFKRTPLHLTPLWYRAFWTRYGLLCLHQPWVIPDYWWKKSLLKDYTSNTDVDFVSSTLYIKHKECSPYPSFTNFRVKSLRIPLQTSLKYISCFKLVSMC